LVVVRTQPGRKTLRITALDLHGPYRTPPYPAVTTSSSTNAVEKAASDMTMGSGTGANGSLEAREGARLTTTRPTARPVTGGVRMMIVEVAIPSARHG
jgi:hypothetical protein